MITRRQALSLLPAALAAQPSKRRNVLLVMTDQHRPHALSIDGDPLARTPHLDAFARSAVRFDRAYCSSPVCVPSRFSLMTGCYPHRGKVWGNNNPWPAEFKTIGDYFTRAGYATANIGKLHAVSEGNHGFQEYLDAKDWLASIGPKAQLFHDEMDKNRRDDRKGPVLVGRASLLAEEDHFESFVARESIRFLKQQRRTRPFLLVSSFLKPHDPFTPAARWANLYPPEKVKLPDTWGKLDLATVPRHIRDAVLHSPHTPELLDPAQARRRIAMYYGNLAQADDRIGAVLATLRELELEDETIVVYLADHGEMAGDKGLWLKFIMYEGSVGVPLMFRVPGMTRAGSRSAAIAGLTQILPTLAELCGLDLPGDLDGRSLVRNLRTPEEQVDTFAYSEINRNGPGSKQMIRRGDLKYCRNANDIDQLYDMRRDPQEMTNLALLAEHKDTVLKLKAELTAVGG
jgi:choline-sulfatase